MGKAITIARQFGSGGRELGRRLAEELGCEYYDREIINAIAEQTDLAVQYVKSVVERRPHDLYPITIGGSFSGVNDYAMRQIQSVYQAQSEIIRDMAAKSDCVIIGRCADYILRDQDPLRLFVYADTESRLQRCMNRRQGDEADLTEKEMRRRIVSVDKSRAKYYELYTGKIWGDMINYDLCVNTTGCDFKQLAAALAKLVR